GGGPGIGVTGGDLHVSERDARIEGSGDEAVAEGVGRDVLGDAGSLGQATHDPRRSLSVKAVSRGTSQERPAQAFTRGEVDGPTDPGRKGDDSELGPLAQDGDGAM